MIKNLVWNNIRPIKGSQKDGFEELVCQLARNEKIEKAKNFTRKGTPDAGVECFWTLEDGSEIAWQAKFFTTPLSTTQWAEIDKSVQTTIKKHPKVKKYVISIPQDRADARVPGKKSFLQKWNERVNKWEKWAIEEKLKIIFEYEGSSELLNKLSDEKNTGKIFFWFGQNEFSSEWFEEQNKGKIKDLGARYSPELNVDLDIKYVFKGLYYSSAYKEQLISKLNDVYIGFKAIIRHLEHSDYNELGNTVKQLKEQFNTALKSLNFIETKQFNKAKNVFQFTRTKLLASNQDFIEKEKLNNNKEETLRYYVKKLEEPLYSIINACSHFDSKLAQNPYLLIEGEAGIGKSHLIADVICEKKINNQFSILLLGQHFIIGNIWTQIFEELDLRISKKEFLGALNSKAESIGSRIIIYIDAINEGEGKYLWKDRLISFIQDFKAFKNLGLVFSIRSTYKDIVLPPNIYNELEHFSHRGLDNNTSAIKNFFNYYKIKEPPIPILNPEFSNPLFLKLFCKGLHDSGLQKIPNSYQGLTTIFEYAIKASNESISSRLDYASKIFDLVNESIKLIVKEIIDSPSLQISKKKAYNILKENFKNDVSDSRKILSELINENIFNENAIYNSETRKYDEEIIYFSYEKFGDHLIISSLLNINKEAILKSKIIEPTTRLYYFIKDENSIMRNQGLVEAMSIQFPEKIGLELYEVIPNNRIYSIGESFLNSFVWRKKSSIDDKVLAYINDYILTINGLNNQFNDLLIQLSIKKDHYFNACFLDSYLTDLPLVERDYLWTIFINDSEFSMPYTLVEWVRESELVLELDEESKKFLSITLTWFLTSSNRELRDNSTKALVKLFQNNLFLLEKLIESFKSINDIYVSERLMAVAFGSITRTKCIKQVKKFAEYIFDLNFKNKIPPENILLRDYARGVIEFAYNINLIDDIDISKVRPPYGSKLSEEIPTEDYIKRYYVEDNKRFNTQNQLYSYVMDYSDFSRYTIGTNSPSNISKIPINSFLFFEKAKESFTQEQNELIEAIEGIVNDYFSGTIKKEAEKEIKEFISSLPEGFEKILNLNEKKSENCVNYIIQKAKSISYINEEGKFDLKDLQRLIIKDVFETSNWNNEYFQEYDYRKFDYFNKKSFNLKEAIGKKYIWIAYHKWLSIIYDNFLIKDKYVSREYEIYDGTWNPLIRDIDPTNLDFFSINKEKYKRGEPTFWSPKLEIKTSNSNEEWISDKADLINPKQLIEFEKEGDIWLNLSSMYSWSKTINNSDRDVWYHLKSYIIKKEDKNNIIEDLPNKSFMNYSLIREQEIYEVFSREYYWSKAYKDLSYNNEWRPIHSDYKDNENNSIITVNEYIWYSDRDFSIKENIHLSKPNGFLVDILNLQKKDKEHYFYDSQDNLIAYDPSIDEQKGVRTLLIKKNILLEKLNELGLEIIWCVLGAKEIIFQNKIIYESRVNNVFYYENHKIKGNFTLKKIDLNKV